MLVENQLVKVKWARANKRFYQDKGYEFSNYDEEFYVNSNDLSEHSMSIVKAKCDYCGKVINVIYNNYTKSISKYPYKFSCKQCVGTKSSEATFSKRQENLYKKILGICNEKGYQLITKKEDILDGCYSKIKYLCPSHGVIESSIGNLSKSKICIYCSHELSGEKKSLATLNERQSKLYDDMQRICDEENYILISKQEDITRNTSKIRYICPIHQEQEIRVRDMQKGCRCNKCRLEEARERYSFSKDEVAKKIQECGSELLNKEDYINCNTKNLKVYCKNCGDVFITSLSTFTDNGGQLCPNCSKSISIGEYKIKQYLLNLHIEFEQEKWFSDCKDTRPLPFDFYIPDINTIIEFDGRQHFEEINIFSYPLEKVQEHDRIKNDYCKDNGINLIRISYKDINKITDILDNKLNLHKDIV